MNRLLATTTLTLTLSLGALYAESNPPAPGAKPPKSKEERQDKMRERMQKLKEELGLTEEQLAKVREAMAAEWEKMGSLRGNSTLTPEQKREAMKQHREKFEAALEAVLTPEQKAKFEEIRAWKKPKDATVKPRA